MRIRRIVNLFTLTCSVLLWITPCPLLFASSFLLSDLKKIHIAHPTVQAATSKPHCSSNSILMKNNNSHSTLPASMRAILYGTSIGAYISRTLPVPNLVKNKNHLLVRVHAVGLNPVDAKAVVGDKLPRNWTRLRAFVHRRAVAGHIPGFDFSGTVVQTSKRSDSNYDDDNNSNDDDDYKVGDAVFGTMPPLQGTLAEYITVPLDQVCRMNMPSQHDSTTTSTTDAFVQAAALPLVGLTALQCLKPHLLLQRRRKSVLIVGASGGTGHVALQVAKALLSSQQSDSHNDNDNDNDNDNSENEPDHRYHITAVCSTRNVDFCREMGATHVVDYSTALSDQDSSNDNSANHNADGLVQALQQSPGCPFDFVLDCVTSDDPRDTETLHYPQVLQAKRAALLAEDYVYRRLGGTTPDWIRAGLQRTVSGGAGGLHGGYWWGRHSEEQLFWIRFPKTAEELKQLSEWSQDGILRVSVAHLYNFSVNGVQQAMNAILSRRVRGKVVVQIYPPLAGIGDTTPQGESTSPIDPLKEE